MSHKTNIKLNQIQVKLLNSLNELVKFASDKRAKLDLNKIYLDATNSYWFFKNSKSYNL